MPRHVERKYAERPLTAAEGEVVAKNLGLVHAYAKRWPVAGVEYDDLISEYTLALMRAVTSWNPQYKLGTWVYANLRQARWQLLHRYRKRRLQPGLQAEDWLFDAAEARVDLQARPAERDEARWLWHLVACLDERSQEVLRRRYVEGGTLKDIGDHFRLSRERIRQIQDEALDELRPFFVPPDSIPA